MVVRVETSQADFSGFQLNWAFPRGEPLFVCKKLQEDAGDFAGSPTKDVLDGRTSDSNWFRSAASWSHWEIGELSVCNCGGGRDPSGAEGKTWEKGVTKHPSRGPSEWLCKGMGGICMGNTAKTNQLLSSEIWEARSRPLGNGFTYPPRQSKLLIYSLCSFPFNSLLFFSSNSHASTIWRAKALSLRTWKARWISIKLFRLTSPLILISLIGGKHTKRFFLLGLLSRAEYWLFVPLPLQLSAFFLYWITLFRIASATPLTITSKPRSCFNSIQSNKRKRRKVFFPLFAHGLEKWNEGRKEGKRSRIWSRKGGKWSRIGAAERSRERRNVRISGAECANAYVLYFDFERKEMKNEKWKNKQKLKNKKQNKQKTKTQKANKATRPLLCLLFSSSFLLQKSVRNGGKARRPWASHLLQNPQQHEAGSIFFFFLFYSSFLFFFDFIFFNYFFLPLSPFSIPSSSLS